MFGFLYRIMWFSDLNKFKSRLNNHWHGHPIKFQPTCYIPGVSGPTLGPGPGCSKLMTLLVNVSFKISNVNI